MSITALSNEIIVSIFKDPDLSHKDICRGQRVCKGWNELLDYDGIWNPTRFHAAFLPTVEGIDTELKAVFRNLFSRSLGYEFFKKCNGKVRDIGIISKKVYDWLIGRNDPFILSEEPQKKICETSWLVIDFSHVWCPYDETLFNELNASTDRRDKPEVSSDRKEMKIPGTLRNRKLLIEHTNPGKRIFYFFLPEALAQCNDAPEKTGFWVVREEEVGQNTDCITQRTEIEAKEGYKLAPLRVGEVFYAFVLCKAGTCPVTAGPNLRFVRTGTTIQLHGWTWSMAISGGFAPGAGVSVDANHNAVHRFCGALPGLPADV